MAKSADDVKRWKGKQGLQMGGEGGRKTVQRLGVRMGEVWW